MSYGHLSIDERERIMKMTAQGYSYGQIAERLGRHKGTISREWRRNVSSTGEYKPHMAQRYYQRRRAAAREPYRLEEDGQLRRYVRSKLQRYWSPEQISGRIQKERALVISNERKRIGDWESDTVAGRKGHGFLAPHVERKSRYTIAVTLENQSADTVPQAALRAMKKLPTEKVKTITFDTGKEFAGFQELDRGLNLRIYFAPPYPRWERGTNENTNGQSRQFFAKGMDFGTIHPSEVDLALSLLNHRPRKCLNSRTPTEFFRSQPICCASD